MYKGIHNNNNELTINPIDGDSLTARKAIASVCKYLKSYFASASNEWVKTPKGALPEVIEIAQPLSVKTRGRAKK